MAVISAMARGGPWRATVLPNAPPTNAAAKVWCGKWSWGLAEPFFARFCGARCSEGRRPGPAAVQGHGRLPQCSRTLLVGRRFPHHLEDMAVPLGQVPPYRSVGVLGRGLGTSTTHACGISHVVCSGRTARPHKAGRSSRSASPLLDGSFSVASRDNRRFTAARVSGRPRRDAHYCWSVSGSLAVALASVASASTAPSPSRDTRRAAGKMGGLWRLRQEQGSDFKVGYLVRGQPSAS